MDGQKLRVMVVDDNVDDVSVFAPFLRHMGCQVEAMTDPRVAISKARAFEPHLALIDLAMPQMSGIALVRALKEAELPPCLFVARTGHIRYELHQECLDAGFNLVLIKPIELAAMSRLIETGRKFAFAFDPGDD